MVNTNKKKNNIKLREKLKHWKTNEKKITDKQNQ